MFKTALLMLCAVAAPMLCPAQLMRVMVAHVKPDRVPEFLDLQKQATAAYEKAGFGFRLVYGPGELGNQSTWYGFTPLGKYAEFDAPPMTAAMGKDAYQEFLHRARNVITDVHYEVVERRPELTIDEGTRPMGLYQVVRLQVKIGHEAAFEAKYKEIIAAAKKIGLKTVLTSRVVQGGPAGLYRVGIPLENFAEMDKGGIGPRAMGKEGYAKWRESLAEHLVSVEYETVRLDPSLSFRK
jgi:hypothetical protein